MTDRSKSGVFAPGKAGLYLLLGLTLLIAAAFETLIETYLLQQAQFQQRTKTADQLGLLRARIEGVINSNILLVQGFASVISTNPDIDQQYFARIGRDITRNSKIIRNIGGAPDLVISLMYPMEGNEAALGLDYNRHPVQRASALMAIENGKLVLAGPVRLKQGGTGFIARIPVYDNNKGSSRLWGILSSVMDTERFYHEAGLYDDLSLQVAIRGKDAAGSAGEQFFGPTSIYAHSPVTETINLPYGSWQLAALPSLGWKTSSPYLWPTRVAALTTTILLLALIYIRHQSGAQRQRLGNELAAANERFNAVLDGMNSIVYVADMHTYDVLYANPKTKRVFGEDIVGKKCWQTLQMDQSGPCNFCTNPRLIDADGSPGPCIASEMVNTVTQKWMHSEAQAIPWVDGRLVRLEVGTDISQMKQNEELLQDAHRDLENIAYFDPLTNLPNRRLLTENFERLAERALEANKFLAICYLDLDGFKHVNDRYGHNAGDDLLIQVAGKLRQTLREGDLTARWGGDEFSVILTIDRLEKLDEILQRILSSVSGHYMLAKARAMVSASIGVSIFPRDETNLDSLLRQADQAMYVAKQKGKQQFCLFDSARDKEIHAKSSKLKRISNAIANDEMLLYYQPKLSLKSGRIYGAEALIRWNDPSEGMIFPGDFLPDIRGTATQCQLDLWVTSTAIRQALEWWTAGNRLTVSINISPYSLQQDSFVEQLCDCLESQPLEPGMIEFEILESDLADIDMVTAVIHRLSEYGLQFALDDYGTGYSSLIYLRQLPVQILKIDQSFVRDMLTDDNDLNIVEGVVGLARAFRKEVIAEGVETLEHGIRLNQMGCPNLQGYGIARPMPAQNMTDWLRDYRLPDEWLFGHGPGAAVLDASGPVKIKSSGRV